MTTRKKPLRILGKDLADESAWWHTIGGDLLHIRRAYPDERTTECDMNIGSSGHDRSPQPDHEGPYRVCATCWAVHQSNKVLP